MSNTETDKGIVDGTDHPTEEKDWGMKYGWFYSPDSEMVYNPQEAGSGPLIVTEKGEIEDRYLGRAMEKRGQGRGGLWSRLGPIEIDGVEIRQNTKLWHDERDEWLRAAEIDVVTEPDVEPSVTFIAGDASRQPQVHLTYLASTLEELRDSEVIESQKEVNERAENVLEEFREKVNAE